MAAAFWSSFALLGYLQTSAYWSLQTGHGLTRTETLDMGLRSGLWLLSTPLVLYLAHRAPLTSPRRPGRLARNLLLHLGAQFLLNLLIAGLVYSLLYQVLGLRTGRAWAPDGVWASMLRQAPAGIPVPRTRATKRRFYAPVGRVAFTGFRKKANALLGLIHCAVPGAGRSPATRAPPNNSHHQNDGRLFVGWAKYRPVRPRAPGD